MKKHSKYKISPIEKKSVVVTTTYKTGQPSIFQEGDLFISREETFRWGYAVIQAYKKDIPKNEEIIVSGFELIDHAYEDGVSVYWQFPDGMSDEDKENIESAFDEDDEDGLEKLGWFYFDNTDKILPPFEIEKME